MYLGAGVGLTLGFIMGGGNFITELFWAAVCFAFGLFIGRNSVSSESSCMEDIHDLSSGRRIYGGGAENKVYMHSIGYLKTEDYRNILKKNINVSLLKVQQQDNNVDCGIFAIAFCTEFCFTGKQGILEAEFDRIRLRPHLLTCLENLDMVPFPKLRKKMKLKKNNPAIEYTISFDCAASCGYTNAFNDMIQCEQNGCSKWFHYKCVDISQASDSLIWSCDSCKK